MLQVDTHTNYYSENLLLFFLFIMTTMAAIDMINSTPNTTATAATTPAANEPDDVGPGSVYKNIIT